MPALVSTLTYNQAKLNMIAENIANVHTPGYRAKRLNTEGFQGALREALDARVADPATTWTVKVDGEVRTNRRGYLNVTPTEKPVENILFHDGTNLSIERQMAGLAETGMMHDLATALLHGRYEGLRKAIRGTV
jgi:flagellar basal-body rod protein FlgB